MAGKTERPRDRQPAEGLSEVLTAFAADLTRMQRSRPPVGLVQVARYVNPQNSGTTALLALLLRGRTATTRPSRCFGACRPTIH